jgi:hypothetical protein
MRFSGAKGRSEYQDTSRHASLYLGYIDGSCFLGMSIVATFVGSHGGKCNKVGAGQQSAPDQCKENNIHCSASTASSTSRVRVGKFFLHDVCFAGK